MKLKGAFIVLKNKEILSPLMEALKRDSKIFPTKIFLIFWWAIENLKIQFNLISILKLNRQGILQQKLALHLKQTFMT